MPKFTVAVKRLVHEISGLTNEKSLNVDIDGVHADCNVCIDNSSLDVAGKLAMKNLVQEFIDQARHGILSQPLIDEMKKRESNVTS